MVLTASRLRRSCALLRASSLSLSKDDCVVRGCVSLDFCCSTCLGASQGPSVQILPGKPETSLTGCGFCSDLHATCRLEGEYPSY